MGAQSRWARDPKTPRECLTDGVSRMVQTRRSHNEHKVRPLVRFASTSREETRLLLTIQARPRLDPARQPHALPRSITTFGDLAGGAVCRPGLPRWSRRVQTIPRSNGFVSRTACVQSSAPTTCHGLTHKLPPHVRGARETTCAWWLEQAPFPQKTVGDPAAARRRSAPARRSPSAAAKAARNRVCSEHADNTPAGGQKPPLAAGMARHLDRAAGCPRQARISGAG